MADTRKTVYTVFKQHAVEIPVATRAVLDDANLAGAARAESITEPAEAWIIVGAFEAYNPLGAKMLAAEKHGTGVYGATPAGSWQTKPLNVGQKVVVEVAEAG